MANPFSWIVTRDDPGDFHCSPERPLVMDAAWMNREADQLFVSMAAFDVDPFIVPWNKLAKPPRHGTSGPAHLSAYGIQRTRMENFDMLRILRYNP